MAQQQAQNVMRRYVDPMLALFYGMAFQVGFGPSGNKSGDNWVFLGVCQRQMQILLGCNCFEGSSIHAARQQERGFLRKILADSATGNWSLLVTAHVERPRC
jgi:hypothetical protein